MRQLRIITVYGTVDYINENDRKVGRDDSGQGSEWYIDNSMTEDEIFSCEPDSSELSSRAPYIAAEKLIELFGNPQDNGHWYSDPDGVYVVNYGTGLECEVSAHPEGFTDVELATIGALLF